MQALNQAIGRTIRHKNDFGAAFIIDNRMKSSYYKDKLSEWMKPIYYRTEEQRKINLPKFFKKMEKKYAKILIEKEKEKPVSIKKEIPVKIEQYLLEVKHDPLKLKLEEANQN